MPKENILSLKSVPSLHDIDVAGYALKCNLWDLGSGLPNQSESLSGVCQISFTCSYIFPDPLGLLECSPEMVYSQKFHDKSNNFLVLQE